MLLIVLGFHLCLLQSSFINPRGRALSKMSHVQREKLLFLVKALGHSAAFVRSPSPSDGNKQQPREISGDRREEEEKEARGEEETSKDQ